MSRTPPFRNSTLSMLAGFLDHKGEGENKGTKQVRLTATADLAFQKASASPNESSDASGNDTLESYNRSDTDSDSSGEVYKINESIHENLYAHPNTFEKKLFEITPPKIINSSSENSNDSSSVGYSRYSDSELSYGTDSERDAGDEADSDNKIKIGDQTIEVDIIRSKEMADLRMDAFAKLEEKLLNLEPITNQDIKLLSGYQDLGRFDMWIDFDDKNLFITGVDNSCSQKVTIKIIEENKKVFQEPIFEEIKPSLNFLGNKLENLRSGLIAIHENPSDLKRIHVVKDGSPLPNPLVEEGRYVKDNGEEHLLRNRLKKLRSELAKFHEYSEHEDLSKFGDNGLAPKLESKPREMDTAENSAATPDPLVTGPAGAKSILPRLKLRQGEENNKR